jgi:hypothetical protein
MSLVSSIDLWTSAKFIGRECATVNKDYLLCKQQANDDPRPCLEQSALVTACTVKVVSELKSTYPKEFSALAKCLDYNDYRYVDCQKESQALRDCWNKDNAK